MRISEGVNGIRIGSGVGGGGTMKPYVNANGDELRVEFGYGSATGTIGWHLAVLSLNADALARGIEIQ